MVLFPLTSFSVWQAVLESSIRFAVCVDSQKNYLMQLISILICRWILIELCGGGLTFET